MLIYLNNLCECNILTGFILLLQKYSSFPGCQEQQFLNLFFSFGNSNKVKYEIFGCRSHQNVIRYLSLLSQLCLSLITSQELCLPRFQLSGKLPFAVSLASEIGYLSASSSPGPLPLPDSDTTVLYSEHPTWTAPAPTWDSWSVAADQPVPVGASAAAHRLGLQDTNRSSLRFNGKMKPCCGRAEGGRYGWGQSQCCPPGLT